MQTLRNLGIALFVVVVAAAAVIGIYSSFHSSVTLERIEKDMPQNTARKVVEMMPTADEIAAMVVGKLPECVTIEQVAALASTPITGTVRVELTECIRICPTEAITPTTTLTTTSTISPTTTLTTTLDCSDIYFAPGETKTIQKGFVIAGDVDVWDKDAWKPLYDSLEKTGLITVLTKETKVRALWGADASSCHKVDNVKAGMIAAGCSEGCDSVVVINWPN